MANTPGRLIRVDDELWDDYGRACDAKGTTRSDDLRAHMTSEVEAWKSGQAEDAPVSQAGDDGAASHVERNQA